MVINGFLSKCRGIHSPSRSKVPNHISAAPFSHATLPQILFTGVRLPPHPYPTFPSTDFFRTDLPSASTLSYIRRLCDSVEHVSWGPYSAKHSLEMDSRAIRCRATDVRPPLSGVVSPSCSIRIGQSPCLLHHVHVTSLRFQKSESGNFRPLVEDLHSIAPFHRSQSRSQTRAS